MSIQRAGDAIQDRLLVRQIWPTDMQGLSKRGFVAEDRQARRPDLASLDVDLDGV